MLHFQTWISYISAFNSTLQRGAQKWAAILNGTGPCESMWLSVLSIACALSSGTNDLFQRLFVISEERKKMLCVGVRTSFVCFFYVSISSFVSIGAALAKACVQAMGSGADWRVRELVLSLSLSLLGVTVQIAPCQARSSNPLLLPQLDPHHSDPSLWGSR